MASRIITKKGSGAPLASDLVHGELAVDTVNKRLYTENAGGTIIELGTAPSTIDINAGTIDGTVIGATTPAAGSFTTISASGEIAANGGVAFGDNDKATFGASDDLQIYHDGSNSYISDQGTGDLNVLANKFLVKSASGGSTLIQADPTATNVQLFFGNAAKLATTATGIDVTGTVTADGLTVNSGSTNQVAQFESTDSTALISIKDSATSSNTHGIGAVGDNLTLYTNGSEAARIDSSGNWLVGTTDATPAQQASVTGISLRTTGAIETAADGGNAARFNRLTSDGSIVEFRKDGTTVGSIGSRSGVASTFILDPRASGTGISAAGVQLWPTNESGTVSNGANDLGGSSARWKDLYLSGGLRGDTLTFSNLAGTERARIDSSGNLLVGCTAKPSASVVGTMISDDLDTEGNKTATSLTTSATHFVFLNPNGAVGSIATSASATVYNTLSDQRLKENIVDAPSASDDIDAIQVRSFDWKADGSHQKYGMVAQELMTVAPEAVSGDPDSDEIMGVDYSKLVPMMMKEIQSLRARVAQLEGVN